MHISTVVVTHEVLAEELRSGSLLLRVSMPATWSTTSLSSGHHRPLPSEGLTTHIPVALSSVALKMVLVGELLPCLSDLCIFLWPGPQHSVGLALFLQDTHGSILPPPTHFKDGVVHWSPIS